jgi:hypothetical protein
VLILDIGPYVLRNYGVAAHKNVSFLPPNDDPTFLLPSILNYIFII